MNLNNNINSSNPEPSSSGLKPVFPPIKRPANEQSLAQSLNKNFIDTPTHFETDYISMKWIPEKRRIDVVWKQFVSEDKVREVLLKEVVMIRHTKVKCLFLDAQKFKGTNPNIPRWANEVWSQMVHDAGLKHFATVVSDKDIFAVFSLKYGMGEKLTSLVNCAVFKTIEESEVWLRQYTHPESPVYSADELEAIMDEHENPKTNSIEAEIKNQPQTKELNTPISVNKIQKDETIKIQTISESEIVGSSKEASKENKEEIEEIIEDKIKGKIEAQIEAKQIQKIDFKPEKAVKQEEEFENTFENEFEEEELEDTDNRLSQIQVFSSFEDLENHIQNIEAKYEANENKSDELEN